MPKYCPPAPPAAKASRQLERAFPARNIDHLPHHPIDAALAAARPPPHPAPGPIGHHGIQRHPPEPDRRRQGRDDGDPLRLKSRHSRRDGRNGHTRPAPAFSRRRGGPRRPRNSPRGRPARGHPSPGERPAGSTARTGLARNTFPVAIAFLQARSTNRSANA